jgi:hypothetical protein
MSLDIVKIGAYGPHNPKKHKGAGAGRGCFKNMSLSVLTSFRQLDKCGIKFNGINIKFDYDGFKFNCINFKFDYNGFKFNCINFKFDYNGFKFNCINFKFDYNVYKFYCGCRGKEREGTSRLCWRIKVVPDFHRALERLGKTKGKAR